MSFSSFTLSLREEITLVPQEPNLILQSPTRKLTFHEPKSGLQAVLYALKQGNKTFDQLKKQVIKTDGIESGEQFDAYLERLIQIGWICHSVAPSLFPLAKAIPMVGNYQFDHYEIDWEQTAFTFSRFAYLRQFEGKTVLESPLSQSKIILLDWRSSALIAKLAQPKTITELIEGIPNISEEIGKQFLYLLLATQMLSFETNEPPLVFWEFHDLLFHSRSRNGRHDYPLGGLFPFKDKIEPLPAVKPLMGDTIIKLAQPNLNQLKQTDIPLTEALEKRRSIREYDETPISTQQLGELLYRCARVKKIFDTEFGEVSRRPYPGGGAIYELELYPIIGHCTGLETGIYQYHPLDHILCPISAWTPETEALITDAWFANGQQVKPQVLLVITARFGRLFWKYRSMAYAAILKHVGVIYQTLYLVATSMHLAPSALGAGNSDLFAAATGIDYYEEASVGEFMLGSVRGK
ncbi:MAG: SagB/ThcOx family dehydrogenase [Merismopedia sp. SIO2A8]|nr:SagB/ThcOx family dehydrogenase [Symploca sp. SIO2B6]NET47314.1 SagB/ThcOx family dehydrogenase [Merismopedia sp. SIO2A8]